MPYKTFDEQVKRASIWLAPTGIPLIAGAAGCAGRGILMTGCFFASILAAFFGLTDIAESAKKSGDQLSKTLFNDWNYGWDSTVEFARSLKELLGGNPVQETKQKYIDKSPPEASKPENTSQKKPIQNTTIKDQQEANLDDSAVRTLGAALQVESGKQLEYNNQNNQHQ